MALPRSPHAISLHLLLFLVAMAAATTRIATADTASADAAAPSSAAGTQSATSVPVFLRARCATTLYPAVCYDSLLPYAATFQTSHVRLARAAADVAAAHLRAFSARVKDLLHRGSDEGGGPRTAAALHDCASTISAAASLAKQSSAELTRLDADGSTSDAATSAGGSRQARWKVSNAQTWLSAAMTNEETCADGFADAGATATESPAGKEVAAGVAGVRQYTSNALALVNGIPL